jgi:hypothetical protein
MLLLLTKMLDSTEMREIDSNTPIPTHTYKDAIVISLGLVRLCRIGGSELFPAGLLL